MHTHYNIVHTLQRPYHMCAAVLYVMIWSLLRLTSDSTNCRMEQTDNDRYKASPMYVHRRGFQVGVRVYT